MAVATPTASAHVTTPDFWDEACKHLIKKTG